MDLAAAAPLDLPDRTACTDQTAPIDQNGRMDHIDQTDQLVRTDRIDQTDRTDRTDQTAGDIPDGGAKPLLDEPQTLAAGIAMWVFVLGPVLALIAAIPIAWGWGLSPSTS